MPHYTKNPFGRNEPIRQFCYRKNATGKSLSIFSRDREMDNHKTIIRL